MGGTTGRTILSKSVVYTLSLESISKGGIASYFACWSWLSIVQRLFSFHIPFAFPYRSQGHPFILMYWTSRCFRIFWCRHTSFVVSSTTDDGALLCTCSQKLTISPLVRSYIVYVGTSLLYPTETSPKVLWSMLMRTSDKAIDFFCIRAVTNKVSSKTFSPKLCLVQTLSFQFIWEQLDQDDPYYYQICSTEQKNS